MADRDAVQAIAREQAHHVLAPPQRHGRAEDDGSQSKPRTAVMAPAVLRSRAPSARPMSGKKGITAPSPSTIRLGVGVGEAGDGHAVRPEYRLPDQEHADRGEQAEDEDDAR